jgi:hypothetical protein
MLEDFISIHQKAEEQVEDNMKKGLATSEHKPWNKNILLLSKIDDNFMNCLIVLK